MTAPWWTRAVVYQIYPRSFSDSNGDGVGDLGGILARLDYLVRLGVDVIWLSPVYRSPQDDNGYDISDYRDIDPLFGTLDELDELIAAAHGRGLKLVMDLVVNHTSDEHSWFLESRSSRDSDRRDWYWWRPPRPGHEPGTPGSEPTNWGAVFGGSAWEYDDATGEYFLHLFSRRQPDLNWENPEVRHAVYEMMRWWLDRGVDGFRMDVINFISKATVPRTDQQPAGLPDGDVGGAPAELARLAHDHAFGDGAPHFMNGPRIHEFLAEMRREVFDRYPDRELLTVGEMPGCTLEEGRRYTDPARGELDMVFQFEHVDLDHGPAGKWDMTATPLALPVLKRSLARWQEGLADRGWNSLYWNNHDQPRVVSRFGDDDPAWRVRSAKALATVLHLHRGTPFVYQGEELGMTNMPWTDAGEFRDLESVNAWRHTSETGGDTNVLWMGLAVRSRDNARTPMQWDASPSAGFTTGAPWLAVNTNYVYLNAADQVNDPESVFAHYQRLVEFRHSSPTVALGRFELLLPDHPTLWAFTRTGDDDRLLVVANFGRAPVDVPDAILEGEWTDVEVVIESGAEQRSASGSRRGSPRRLAGWEAVVLRRA